MVAILILKRGNVGAFPPDRIKSKPELLNEKLLKSHFSSTKT